MVHYMKQIASVIEKVEYTKYSYDSIKEKEQHILDMEKDGFECLYNFADNKEVTYRKFY